MKEKKDLVEGFYREVAEILGVEYNCTGFPHHKRTRWNNRAPGHGRYPGFGIVRLFGDVVHVALTHPVAISRQFSSRKDALDYFRSMPVE